MRTKEWSIRSSLLASAIALAVGFVPAVFAEDEAPVDDPILVDPMPVDDCGEACMSGVVDDGATTGEEVVIDDGTSIPVEDCGEACMFYTLGGEEPTDPAEGGINPVDPLPIDDCGEACMSGVGVDDGATGEEVVIDDGTAIPMEDCGEACYNMVEDGVNNIRNVEMTDREEMLPLMSNAPEVETTAIESTIDVSATAGIADYLESSALESVDTGSADSDTAAIEVDGPAVDVAQTDGKTTAIRGGHLQ